MFIAKCQYFEQAVFSNLFDQLPRLGLIWLPFLSTSRLAAANQDILKSIMTSTHYMLEQALARNL